MCAINIGQRVNHPLQIRSAVCFPPYDLWGGVWLWHDRHPYSMHTVHHGGRHTHACLTVRARMGGRAHIGTDMSVMARGHGGSSNKHSNKSSNVFSWQRERGFICHLLRKDR